MSDVNTHAALTTTQLLRSYAMAKSSLSYVRLSLQELTALSNVIYMSFQAFEAGDYPPFFESYLTAILQVINLGSAAVMHAMPKISYTEFSAEIDKLAGFIREAKIATLKRNS